VSVGIGRPGTPPPTPARSARLKAPLLIALWALLAFEAAGGLVIFFARLATGTTPGETLHVALGVVLALVYAAYQWGHWHRVAPFRARLDYALGLIAALAMTATNLTGLWLGLAWWRERVLHATAGPVAYDTLLSAAHNIGSLVTLTFLGAHLVAVFRRDARARRVLSS
jgi:hypothetical protein